MRRVVCMVIMQGILRNIEKSREKQHLGLPFLSVPRIRTIVGAICKSTSEVARF